MVILNVGHHGLHRLQGQGRGAKAFTLIKGRLRRTVWFGRGHFFFQNANNVRGERRVHVRVCRGDGEFTTGTVKSHEPVNTYKRARS